MSVRGPCVWYAAKLPSRRGTIWVVYLALVLTACTGAADNTAKTDTSILTIAVENLGSQLYAPWLSGQENRPIAELIGDTLTIVDKKTNELKGGLATEWSLSDDHKTWDIKLGANVPFQDGYGNVTADDVKLSFEQWLNPASVQAPPAEQLKQTIDGDIKNFEVVGPLEFKLHTQHPVVSLPYLLSDSGSSLTIQSKKYFDEKGEEAYKHPLGTGPFSIAACPYRPARDWLLRQSKEAADDMVGAVDRDLSSRLDWTSYPKAMYDWYRTERLSASPNIAAEQYAAQADEDLEWTLPLIEPPTLLFVPDESLVAANQQMREMARVIPHAHIADLPLRHRPVWYHFGEAPEYAAAFQRFVARVA